MAVPRASELERGATSVVVAVVIATLVAVLALAINVGHLLSVRGELQNAVDSAALAGTLQLNGTAEGASAAHAAATSFASAHLIDGAASERVATSAIELGEWSRASRSFTPRSDAVSVNAVRVVSLRQEPVWMGWFVGRGPGPAETAVRAEAIAVGGGLSETPCAHLPFVLRRGCAAGRCTLPADVPEYSGGLHHVAAAGPVARAGTTALLPSGGVSVPRVCELLQNPRYCEEQRPGDPPGADDRIETVDGEDRLGATCAPDGDGSPLDDGVVCDDILRSLVHGGALALIPVVQLDAESASHCDPAVDEWGGDAAIVGFASVKVVFVQCDEKRPEDAAAAPALTPGEIEALRTACWPRGGGGKRNNEKKSGRCVVLDLRCNVKDARSDAPGGAWFGTGPVLPRLAR